jgi:hypothetical protein
MSMYPIASVSVGAGGASSVALSSIPQTFTHLQVRVFARGTSAGTYDYSYFGLNADSANNYARHRIDGDGATASSYAQTVVSGFFGPTMPYASGGANIFGVGIIDILDYTNTNKYKVVKVLGGTDLNGSGKVQLTSGLWLNTTAVTSVNFGFPAFAQYSRFDLYGITTA